MIKDLKDILGDIACPDQNLPAIDIAGIETNSANISRGDIFIAIVGNKADGHNYIEDVVDRWEQNARTSGRCGCWRISSMHSAYGSLAQSRSPIAARREPGRTCLALPDCLAKSIFVMVTPPVCASSSVTRPNGPGSLKQTSTRDDASETALSDSNTVVRDHHWWMCTPTTL